MTPRDRKKLWEARRHLDSAADLLGDVVLAADLHYAQQDAQWQEGEPGMANCRRTEALRVAIDQIRRMDVFGEGRFGAGETLTSTNAVGAL